MLGNIRKELLEEYIRTIGFDTYLYSFDMENKTRINTDLGSVLNTTVGNPE